MSKLPPYGSLSPADYAELGLMSGLEIHQQLHTAKKLFCHCPARRYTSEYDAEILRHMRPTLSEMGEYDGTALMEFKTKKEILYRLKNESVCTYDMDDAPPFGLNPQALEIAMEISLLLGLQRVGEIHIARKQYLDGSIPTGFQRTTILGVQGSVPFLGRQLSITQLGLEEDSCREVSDIGHWRIYKTDRLGMPLIEIVTGPDFRTPAEVEAGAQLLRRLVRTTGKVRTGAGAARQDVNVSVAGGTRVEIKGVPSIRAIGRLVHVEALRQKNLLSVRETLHSRLDRSIGYSAQRVDVTELISESEFRPLQRAIERGESIGAIALPGFAGLMMEEIQPGIPFLREFEDRVRVIACLDRQPSLVSSEQLAGGPGALEWKRVRQAVGCEGDTPILLVWGPAEDIPTALAEIEIRAQEALAGIPPETRQAQLDGSTRFERVLPGADRMYPDTDLPPLPLATERWERIKAQLPPTPWQQDAGLAALGLNGELREQLLADGRGAACLRLAAAGCDPVRLALLLTSHWRCLQRRGTRMPDPATLTWPPAFFAAAPREADRDALLSWANTGESPAPPELPSRLRLERAVVETMTERPEPFSKDPAARLRCWAGRTRTRLGQTPSGRELMETLERLAPSGGGETA